MSDTWGLPKARLRRSLAMLPVCALAACTHVNLENCPENAAFGKDVPRVRSSHYRMELANPAAAAARFLPYAAMSAYAYRDGPDCNPPGLNPMSDENEAKLRAALNTTTPTDHAWQRVPALEPRGGCEDDRGMMYHVWQRDTSEGKTVVIAFRGTSTTNDWWYGNFWWGTRYLFGDNQITRARRSAGAIIEHFRNEAKAANRSVRFYATGHSLGGSLAQHVLYAYPREVLQAIVFDPSAVTGFDDLTLEQQLEGCACRDEVAPEARMMRVYESGEILANLRIFHKIWFPPHRHIQEVRLPLIRSRNPVKGHGIAAFTEKLAEATAGKPVFEPATQWYASADATCTRKFVDAQKASCRAVGSASDRCPP